MYSQKHVQLSLRSLDAARSAGRGNTSAAARRKASPGSAPPMDLPRPLVCDQQAGDVMVVPETWGHATINSAPWSIGWATELSFERTFDLGLGSPHGKEWWRYAEQPVEGSEEAAEEAAALAKEGRLGAGRRKRQKRKRQKKKTTTSSAHVR